MSKWVGTCWILCVRQNIGEDLNRNAVVVYELLGNPISNPSATKIDYIAFGMSKWVGILMIKLHCHTIAKGVYRNAVVVDGHLGNHIWDTSPNMAVAIEFGMSKLVGKFWIPFLSDKRAKGLLRDAVVVGGLLVNPSLNHFSRTGGWHRVRHVQISRNTMDSCSLSKQSERPLS